MDLDDALYLQKVKLYFVYLLWLETKLSIVDGLTTLNHSIDGWVIDARGFFVFFFLFSFEIGGTLVLRISFLVHLGNFSFFHFLFSLLIRL